MTKPIPFFFSLPELQKAVAEARPSLEGREEARTRVSNDIKQLEAYLEGLSLREEFRHPLGKAFAAPDDEDGKQVTMALEFGGCASGVIQEQALAWEPDNKGRYRLMHEVTEWEGSIDVDLAAGPYFWDESTARRTAKPLIETKFEIRKTMHQHLPAFVRALTSSLAIPLQPRSTATEGDLPS